MDFSSSVAEEEDHDKRERNRKPREKPNILIILADDVGTGDIPFYWKGQKTSVVKMPHLQTLADKGVVFMDAHSSPKCAPSRYMMLSGNYPHRGSNIYGTSKLKQDHSQFTTFQKSIAELLREEARYDTAVFGKVSFLHRYLLLNFN